MGYIDGIHVTIYSIHVSFGFEAVSFPTPGLPGQLDFPPNPPRQRLDGRSSRRPTKLRSALRRRLRRDVFEVQRPHQLHQGSVPLGAGCLEFVSLLVRKNHWCSIFESWGGYDFSIIVGNLRADKLIWLGMMGNSDLKSGKWAYGLG